MDKSYNIICIPTRHDRNAALQVLSAAYKWLIRKGKRLIETDENLSLPNIYFTTPNVNRL